MNQPNWWRTTVLPDHCANLACPNRPEEGRFVLVQTERPVVAQHRPLMFYVCAPCAEAMSRG